MNIKDLFKKFNLTDQTSTNETYYITEDFEDALKVEKQWQPVADEFYKNVFNATQIKRYDYNNPTHRVFQKDDIDCSVEMYAKALDIFWLNISEKFRQYDYGDMCIEIWSDFENKKPGWAVTGIPDMYLYVTPKHFYSVFMNAQFKSLVNKITTEWDWEKCKALMDSEDKKHKLGWDWNGSYKISVDGHDATLTRAWSQNKGNHWCGVCICIPWETLFNKFFIDINMYDRNYNKLNISELLSH